MYQINRKQLISWCLFDFANSSYSAVIAAVIFPVFYVSSIAGEAAGQGDLWWGRAISLSMAFVAVTSPFLGGIADYSGKRKRLLLLYTVVCIISVAFLSFLKKGMVLEGFFLVLTANIGMEGGIVFYNSFLPVIARHEYQGRVSAWGFGVGYAGSILSLLLALPLVISGQYAETWIMVSLFFAVFSLPAFLFLPGDAHAGITVSGAAARGWTYFRAVMREIVANREMRKFMLSYLIYEDGVVTVIVFSSIFAATTLGFSPKELIALYLIVQVTALAGAFAMAKPMDAWGPKKIVVLSLLLWAAVSVSAYFIADKVHFFLLSSVAGLGLGTVQAASRAFFAQFIPQGRESEYFGTYALVGKSSAIIGPLVFGYVSSTFGSQRPAILAVSLFFITGLVMVSGIQGGGPNIDEKKQGNVSD
ncbi:MAG TPA: MFS transporter [Thermodesulfovibrionales bacterium]|nr:MFS transporter [Thermodesulfovibrionales bacterium]